MGKNAKVSSAVIKRLPRYRRYLIDLRKKGVERISSGEFSRLVGYTASQIRQDLNNFGGFGQQGYGYNVEDLLRELNGILGLSTSYNMIIIGAGNLGQALANYTHYQKSGFVVKGIFEVDPQLIGTKINGVDVHAYDELGDFIEAEDISIGIICTTKDSAQAAADKMCKGGVKGIWNFAPVDIDVPEGISLENVHLSDSLHSLAYYINN